MRAHTPKRRTTAGAAKPTADLTTGARCYLHACALRIGAGAGGMPPVQMVRRPTEGRLFASPGFAAAWDSFVLPAMGLPPGPLPAAGQAVSGSGSGGVSDMLACLSESDPLVMA